MSVLQIGQIRPEIMNRFNFDAYGKFIAKSYDFPNELIKDDATVEAEAEQQAARRHHLTCIPWRVLAKSPPLAGWFECECQCERECERECQRGRGRERAAARHGACSVGRRPRNRR